MEAAVSEEAARNHIMLHAAIALRRTARRRAVIARRRATVRREVRPATAVAVAAAGHRVTARPGALRVTVVAAGDTAAVAVAILKVAVADTIAKA